ncbi:MAG: carbohydrate ABC transporter permease [Oscillospiraceae bacterium]
MEKTKRIQSKGEILFSISAHIILFLASVVCVGSFLIVIGASFQSQEEIMKYGYSIIPRQCTLEGYKAVFANSKQLVTAYWNTIITTIIGTVLGVALSASAGYVMSRKTYKYRNILSFYVFFTMMFNGGLVPSYILISNWLGLKNNLWALILPMLVSGWYIILMKGYFNDVPEALIESAKLDGASELYIFAKIVIPISTPVLATIALFYVLGYWNDWYLSLLYTTESSLYKLQYLLMNILKSAEFLNSSEAKALQVDQIAKIPTLNVRMAMCVLAAGPILIIFPFFQKYFVRGITVGAVKG